MKLIVNVIDLVPAIMEVPDDYIQCSVSGEYRPHSEFCDETGKQDRTNCIGTYQLSTLEFNELRGKGITVMKGKIYRDLVNKLHKSVSYRDSSQSVDDVITMLMTLKEKEPNCRIVFTQEGYYADGRLASLYDTPEHAYDLIDGTKVFSIGHSCQNY